MNDDEKIFPDDPRAAFEAQLVLPTGTTQPIWVSRHGFVTPDESHARWHGSTHKRCEGCDCGGYPKNSYCQRKANKKAAEKHAARPSRDWTEGEMICTERGDHCMSYFDEMAEKVYFGEASLSDHWVFAEPARPKRWLEIEDEFSEYMYDGFTFEQDTHEAEAELNRLVERDLSKCFFPGETRVKFAAYREWALMKFFVDFEK